jgi:predicted acylesterase/phospholipase RssA
MIPWGDTMATPNATAMPVQLVLQGGGAKLIALLAAMEAVEELEAQGRIAVTRLCGTSAGAIAACLFAARVPMKEARKSFESHFKGKIKDLFPIPSNKSFLYSTYKEKTIWETEPILKFLETIFGNKKLAELVVPAAVVVSDLSNARPLILSSWDKGEQGRRVADALLDSMALPFFFRIWRDDGPVLVDGGISNNLPSSVLLDVDVSHLSLEERLQQGEIFGLTFPKEAAQPISGAKDFTVALIGTAIDTAADRERARLGGRLHEIRTSLTTLDFEEALNIPERDFQEIKSRAAEFFLRQADQSRKRWIHYDFWKENNLPILQSLWQVYKGQHGSVENIRYKSCRNVWEARGLDHPEDTDRYETEVVFSVGKEPLYCQSIGVAQEMATFLGQMEFEVFDDNSDEKIEYHALPARDPTAPQMRKLLFHYLPALPKESGPYQLNFTESIKDSSKKLLLGEKDTFTYTTRRADGPVESIELILLFPSNVKISWEWIGTAGEQIKRLKVSKEPAYNWLGWRAKNWPGNTKFGVSLWKQP